MVRKQWKVKQIFLKPCKNSCLWRSNSTSAKNGKEINGPVEINTELQDFCKKLFINHFSISKQNVENLENFENLPVPKVQEEQVIKCEGEITESELLKSLKSMKDDKSPVIRVMMPSQKGLLKPFGKKLKPLLPTQ